MKHLVSLSHDCRKQDIRRRGEDVREVAYNPWKFIANQLENWEGSWCGKMTKINWIQQAMAKEKSSEQVMWEKKNLGIPNLNQCDELPEGNKVPQCFHCSLSSWFLKVRICRKICNWVEEKSSILWIMLEKNDEVYYSFLDKIQGRQSCWGFRISLS